MTENRPTSSPEMRRYTRWTRPGGGAHLVADILGARYEIQAWTNLGRVSLSPQDLEALEGMSPDEARLLGVRLIEAAALADGERAIRDMP